MSGTERSLLFSRAEFEERLLGLRAAMAGRNVDAVIVDETEILHYLTGYTISQNQWRCCLVPLRGEPIMVLRRLDVLPFLERSWLSRHVGFRDWEDPIAVVAGVIEAEGWGAATIGYDPNSTGMTVARFRALETALPRAQFVEFAGVLRELRLRKSPAEIEYLRKAAAVADGSMVEAAKAAGPGRSERDVAAATSAAFVRLGADHGRVGPVTAGGKGWGFLHGHLHDRPMEAGDVLHVELVPTVYGYGARLMRPIIIGAPTDRQLHDASRIIALQDAQFSAMRPGAIMADVDAVLRRGMIEAGLRENYENPTGYTLGYFHFSSTRTSDFTRVFLPGAEWPLQEGMVFHMYTSAAGMAFSETVLVTADGAERLTRLPRHILVASEG